MSRATTLTLLTFALVAMLSAYVFPWHQPDGAAEWDDGEHMWGRNIHDTSLFVTDLGTEVAEDDTGVLLRQVGFWAFTGGLAFTSIAFLFAAVDRRGWTLGLAWPAWLATAGGATSVVLGLGQELTAWSDLSIGIGLIGAGAAVLLGFIANWTAIGLGKTDAAARRRQERALAKKLRDEERERRRIAEEAAGI